MTHCVGSAESRTGVREELVQLPLYTVRSMSCIAVEMSLLIRICQAISYHPDQIAFLARRSEVCRRFRKRCRNGRFRNRGMYICHHQSRSPRVFHALTQVQMAQLPCEGGSVTALRRIRFCHEFRARNEFTFMRGQEAYPFSTAPAVTCTVSTSSTDVLKAIVGLPRRTQFQARERRSGGGVF